MAREKHLLIYVAGAYSAPNKARIMLNVQKAIDAGIALYLKGHFPFIPHLTHYIDKRAKEKRIGLKWEDYIKMDLPWLKRCDALLLLGHSKGADLELKEAKRLRKKIFYSIDDVPN